MRYMLFFLLLFDGIANAKNYCSECECCKNGTKRCIDNGFHIKCLDGCIDGYYGVDCSHACISNCLSCSNNTTCTTCGTGFYGESCNRCPHNCLTCSSPDNCQKCKDGFYNGRYADTIGPYYNNCKFACPKNCASCTSYRNCIQYDCKEGFYRTDCNKCTDGRFGVNCEQNCLENCLICMNGTTCIKCSPRHFGDKCELCPPHCSSCNSSNHCTACDRGYYGEVCNLKCPKHCFNNDCDKLNGTCKSCIDGFYGKYCKTNCPGNCLDSKCSLVGNCSSCVERYYGDNCTVMCSQNCKSCDFRTGYCQTCIDGFHGSECRKKCSPRCKKCQKSNGYCNECFASFSKKDLGICEKTRGCDRNCKMCNNQYKLCTSCIDGKFGQMIGSEFPHCKLNCPDVCLNKECDVQTGHCIMGCLAGYWGLYCTNLCPLQCTDGECFRDNGTCTEGSHCACPSYCECDSQGKCKSINSGVSLKSGQDICKYCPDSCKVQQDTATDTVSSVVIICASAGALVFVLAIGSAIDSLKRRNSRVEKKETDKDCNTYRTVSKKDQKDADIPRAKIVQECVLTHGSGKSRSCSSSNYKISTSGKVTDYENAGVLAYERPSVYINTKDIGQEVAFIFDCGTSRKCGYPTSEEENYEKVILYENAEVNDYEKLASETGTKETS